MPITNGFNHIATLTHDMDLTVGFYENVLDAEVIHTIEKQGDHPYMKIVHIGGGAALNIFEVPLESIIGERRTIGARGAVDHFGFNCDSLATLEKIRDRLVEHNAQEVGEIQRLGGEWSLFFRDPNGMELEMCCTADAD